MASRKHTCPRDRQECRALSKPTSWRVFSVCSLHHLTHKAAQSSHCQHPARGDWARLPGGTGQASNPMEEVTWPQQTGAFRLKSKTSTAVILRCYGFPLPPDSQQPLSRQQPSSVQGGRRRRSPATCAPGSEGQGGVLQTSVVYWYVQSKHIQNGNGKVKILSTCNS